MILKWIQSISQPSTTAEAAKRADDEERKTRKESKLVDLAHEAMVDNSKKAANDNAVLEGLIKMGWPLVQREKFKGKVRKKVWEIISKDSNIANPTIVDEITERIADVAEADPFYKKMFDKEA